MTHAASRRRSAIISYSHTETGWSREQTEERLQQVHRLVFTLRTDGGIAADADIFHQNEDWTRWGPQQVETSDFVLIIASPAWRNAWAGGGDPRTNKGIRAEADAVRSIQAQGHDVLQRRVRLILLPGSTDADIPNGMHGIARYYLEGLELADLEALLRDLTDQPMFVKPPVGDIPIFPPAMTTRTPDVARLDASQADARPPFGSANEAEKQERIQQLRDQLDALPDPLPGEGPHLPWFRARQQIESRLVTELRESTIANDTGPAARTEVNWEPASNVPIKWAEQWRPGVSYQQSAIVLHLLPVPQLIVSQRVMGSLDGTVTDLIYKTGHLQLGQALEKRFGGDEIVVEIEVPRRGHNEVDLGRLLGCRVSSSGQVSVWFSLARDSMGAVLDQNRITTDLQRGLELTALILKSTQGDNLGRVAIAAELVNLTMLTDGTLDQLGRRSRAGLAGLSGRKPPRMTPDESVPPAALQGPTARRVAAEITKVIIRDWQG